MIAGLKFDVAKNCINTGRGIGNKDDGFLRRVDESCNNFAGGVQMRGILVPDEVVRARFDRVLEGMENTSDGTGVGSERACDGIRDSLKLASYRGDRMTTKPL